MASQRVARERDSEAITRTIVRNGHERSAATMTRVLGRVSVNNNLNAAILLRESVNAVERGDDVVRTGARDLLHGMRRANGDGLGL